MASRRDQIIAAIVAAVNGVGKPAGLVVARTRVLPTEQENLPFTGVYPIQEETRRKGGEWGPLVLRRLLIRLEIRVKGEPTDAGIDAIATWCVQTIVGNQTTGGLTKSIHETGMQWARGEAENVVLGAAAIDFEVRYETQADDPESA
jgi:hypothetical protein